eukprot:1161541-Pelagomonas_calceolata.AAC.8
MALAFGLSEVLWLLLGPGMHAKQREASEVLWLKQGPYMHASAGTNLGAGGSQWHRQAVFAFANCTAVGYSRVCHCKLQPRDTPVSALADYSRRMRARLRRLQRWETQLCPPLQTLAVAYSRVRLYELQLWDTAVSASANCSCEIQV